MSNLPDTVSLIITALLVPLIGLIVWIVRKFVQASIDHTSVLTSKFDMLDASIRELIEAINKITK
jgi:hypothetical protein